MEWIVKNVMDLAADHVDFHTKNPGDTAARYISQSSDHYRDSRIWIFVLYAMEED